MNVCVVGHGMMGVWHSDALAQTDCVRHTLVGRRAAPTSEFAQARGFGRWSTSLEEALADESLDVVIVANPSEQHATAALLALQRGKHVLVEIPLAMSIADAERIVDEAAERSLALGVVHPLRARPELIALRERIAGGGERLRHVAGRLFMHRLENVGATGYRRSWTDNLLWHHMAHIVDASMWLCGTPLVRADSVMSPIDEATGIPMDVAILGATAQGQSLAASGSYYGRERIFDLLTVTDRDSYRLDVFHNELTSGEGTVPIASEADNCGLVTLDFLAAVAEGREPLIPGAAVLPAMRVLASVQERWDEEYGRRSLPGRPGEAGERPGEHRR